LNTETGPRGRFCVGDGHALCPSGLGRPGPGRGLAITILCVFRRSRPRQWILRFLRGGQFVDVDLESITATRLCIRSVPGDEAGRPQIPSNPYNIVRLHTATEPTFSAPTTASCRSMESLGCLRYTSMTIRPIATALDRFWLPKSSIAKNGHGPGHPSCGPRSDRD
jgi:hypothetical protein